MSRFAADAGPWHWSHWRFGHLCFDSWAVPGFQRARGKEGSSLPTYCPLYYIYICIYIMRYTIHDQI